MFLLLFLCQLDHENPQVILESTRKQLSEIRTLDYIFSVSAYQDRPLRFRSNLAMARMDGTFPVGSSRVPAGMEPSGSQKTTLVNYAYNGDRFQQRTDFDKYLAISRSRIGGKQNRFSGPCWSPIEECYQWLSIVDYFGYNWQSARDPATWMKLRPAPTVETAEVDGTVALRLRLETDVKWYQQLFIAPDYGHFPIRFVMYSDDDEPVEEMTARDFQLFGQPNMRIWLPMKVVHRYYEYKLQHARTQEYTIDPLTVVVNQDVDPIVFDLEKCETVASIFDLDKQEMFRVGESKPVFTVRERKDISNDNRADDAGKTTRSRRVLLFLVNAVVVIVVATYAVWRTRARSD